MDDKKRLIAESLRYLNEGKRSYSQTDIIVYRLRLGEGWTNRERRRSAFKIGVGVILSAVGVGTLWFPSGSFFMIGAGCSLMIDGGLDLWGAYRKAKRKAVFMVWNIKRGYCRLKKEVVGAIISKPTLLNLRCLKGGYKNG